MDRSDSEDSALVDRASLSAGNTLRHRGGRILSPNRARAATTSDLGFPLVLNTPKPSVMGTSTEDIAGNVILSFNSQLFTVLKSLLRCSL